MKIRYHQTFKKNYKKRIAPFPSLEKKFEKCLLWLSQNPRHPLLRTHKLVGGKRSYKAFSVTGDIRVIYKIEKDELWLLDIGSHNQVY